MCNTGEVPDSFGKTELDAVLFATADGRHTVTLEPAASVTSTEDGSRVSVPAVTPVTRKAELFAELDAPDTETQKPGTMDEKPFPLSFIVLVAASNEIVDAVRVTLELSESRVPTDFIKPELLFTISISAPMEISVSSTAPFVREAEDPFQYSKRQSSAELPPPVPVKSSWITLPARPSVRDTMEAATDVVVDVVLVKRQLSGTVPVIVPVPPALLVAPPVPVKVPFRRFP